MIALSLGDLVAVGLFLAGFTTGVLGLSLVLIALAVKR